MHKKQVSEGRNGTREGFLDYFVEILELATPFVVSEDNRRTLNAESLRMSFFREQTHNLFDEYLRFMDYKVGTTSLSSGPSSRGWIFFSLS